MRSYKNINTLNSYIKLGSSESYSIPNSTYLYRLENVVSMDNLIYDKYDKILMRSAVYKSLSDDEIIRYRYKPELFSLDVYGNPMLSHLILYLNRCSEFEFNLDKIRYIPQERIADIFGYIMAHETELMKKFNAKEVG